jgi:xanthine dehydrogenase accessory factor
MQFNFDACVIVKGSGDLGTGVAYRLHQCGFRVLCTDLSKPTVIRRSVAFATALYDNTITIESVSAQKITHAGQANACWQSGKIAVIADPACVSRHHLLPIGIVDCILAKRNIGTSIADAPIVIACGPGFNAGVDCHAVVETQRGHDLGRVIWHGSAAPNTGMPGEIDGHSIQRVVRAPCEGIFRGKRRIGDTVVTGEIIAHVGDTPVFAAIPGIVRGLIHDELSVTRGMKIGDIDPRAKVQNCYTISDKALAIGGGVVEALFSILNRSRLA